MLSLSSIIHLFLVNLVTSQVIQVAPAVGVARPVATKKVWTERIFAPYLSVVPVPNYDVSTCISLTQLSTFTLSYVNADRNGKPSWGGAIPVTDSFFVDYISEIRKQNGDIIVSFGGAGGDDLAAVANNSQELADLYQQVIDQYSLTFIDVDIQANFTLVDKIAEALALVKTKNPTIHTAVTVAATPSGLDANSTKILQTLIDKKFTPDVVNLLTFDFVGSESVKKAMGTAVISSAEGAYDQIQKLGLQTSRIGITPMIGVNDFADEIFRLEDAVQVKDWAKKTPWLVYISFWSINRDTSSYNAHYASSQIAQHTYAFTEIFQDWSLTSPSNTIEKRGHIYARGVSVADWNRCYAENGDVCAVAGSSCCYGSTNDYASGATTCRPPGWCYSPPKIADWNDCTKFDLCANTGSTCCFGSSYDATSGKTTCRPAGYCYTAPKANPLPSKVFAPIVDVLQWPVFDIVLSAKDTGNLWYTLASITSDGFGNPAWGSTVTLSERYYFSYIQKLVALGGNIIISFGGSHGPELATDSRIATVPALQAAYQSVLTMYNPAGIDFTIIGSEVSNTAANNLRAQALVGIKKANPDVKISFTLEVTASGLGTSQVSLLSSLVSNGLAIDTLNILAMDFAGSVPDVGAAAISAGQAAYSQLTKADLTNTKIGVIPMIGANNVANQVFSLDHARALVNWAAQQSFVSTLSMSTANRDINAVSAPVFSSSKIAQKQYDFANILKLWPTTVGVPATKPTPVQPDPKYLGGYNWASKIVAPFVDVSQSPPFDFVAHSKGSGASRFILGFINAATDGSPAWSGTKSISKLDWIASIQALRLFGGDVIISFGGPSGTELALSGKTLKQLTSSYMNVIDAYTVSWLDFYIAGSSLSNQASIDLRNQALRAIQVANPNIRISYTLPGSSSGLTTESLNVLTSAVNYGVRVDVVNILANANGAITAATTQLSTIGLSAKLGLSPTLGTNSATGEVFQVTDAAALVKWAKTNNQVRLLSFVNANRDFAASSGVTQKDRQFTQNFVQYEN